MKYLAPLAGFGLALLIGSSFLYVQAHSEGEHRPMTNSEYCNLEVYPEHENDIFRCGESPDIEITPHTENKTNEEKPSQEPTTEPTQTHQVVKVKPTNDDICGN